MTIANVPDWRLTLDGKDLTPKIAPRLVSLSISEKRGEDADQLDLVLSDTDGKLALPKEGAVLHVQLGWAQGSEVTVGLVDKGSFTVDEVSHAGPPDLVTIRARSADFTSELKTRREKGWHGTTLGAIAGEIAQRHGLTLRCASVLSSIAVTTRAQSRESDLAFLRRLGREHNAVATVKRGSLVLSPVGAGTTPSGKTLPAITIRRRDGDRHSYNRQKRDDVAGVTASYHDRKAGKRQTVTAGTEEGAKKLSRVYGSKTEAHRAAHAARGRTARATASLSLTLALGRPDIYPEQMATATGFKAEIDATTWLVSEVTHKLDGAYTTEIKLELL